jgi:hypothetical protein
MQSIKAIFSEVSERSVALTSAIFTLFSFPLSRAFPLPVPFPLLFFHNLLDKIIFWGYNKEKRTCAKPMEIK